MACSISSALALIRSKTTGCSVMMSICCQLKWNDQPACAAPLKAGRRPRGRTGALAALDRMLHNLPRPRKGA